MRITLDTNILVYALDPAEPAKRAIAEDIIERGQYVGVILTAQVLGEFVNAVRRKNPVALEDAITFVELWSTVFPIVSTDPDHIGAAARLAVRHRLQFWDSVILAIARSESVGVLLTEDLQDGATIDGVTIINPFNPANANAVQHLLTR